MYPERRILATFFDMDGIIIDSEPLWFQAKNEVLSKLNIDISCYTKLPNTIGLRIDQVICTWYELLPLNKPSKKEIIDMITTNVMILIEEKKPLLPGVKFALKLCKKYNFKIGLASASPLRMLERVLDIFNLTHYFDLIISSENLPYSKPHPQIYLDAATQFDINPQKCVAIEDSFNGMIAVKAARMRSIVIPAIEYHNDLVWSVADVKLKSLAQLTFAHLNG
ncbi:2-deoxyglucose-6-phosphatase [Candidatus Pantoea edessiphila]|uniref:2-deoxyglucose-6-phosphatase n=1 Tax=Candidatus Pantoea edessiphila TaxID=2044610 RepID=A0A2P5T2H3_9GAMM|nr:hexitol phosphatase HxpB [Candidatus Pantoea edessiphila]PPI88795.1 2-deoxyglucose-6-phosphatase [Candidatus Pantoea edessiphila]